jgi:hypothetical protein
MYRHRSTGFEFIAGDRVAVFETTVTRELTGNRPEGFINADTPLFERIATYPAVFNRALIYRGINLHSGDIDPTFSFDEDPRRGRLTASTVFFFGTPPPSLMPKTSAKIDRRAAPPLKIRSQGAMPFS